MSMTVQSGNTSVTGNVNAIVTGTPPTLPAGATQIVRNGGSDGNQTVTISTTTHGKTFYMTWIHCSIVVTGTDAHGVQVQADHDGTGAYPSIINMLATPLATQNIEYSESIVFSPPIQIPQDKIVRVAGQPNTSARVSLGGWEA